MNKWVTNRWVCWGALCGLILWGGCGSSTGGGKSDSATGSSTAGLPDGFSPQQDSGGGGECNPGQKSCEGNSRLQCGLDGYWSDPTPCPAGTVCSGGVCAPCQPGQKLCQGQMIVECSADGTSAVPAGTCPDQCYNGVCVNCTPGAKECRAGPDETQETWECVAVSAEAAEWQKTASCPEGTDCVQGLCINPCQSDIKLNTNQGCDYYALDLENSAEAGSSGATPANGQFAVIVSNPSALKTITVTVHETQKGDAIVTEAVGPGGLSIIPLGPRNITGTLQGEYAWRVKGTAPFVAYQFNPLDNVNPVYSNDASLLLPVNALGKDYMVMTASGGGPFLTVVGTASATEVTVTVTAATEAGPNIPALAAGETYTATIGAAEVSQHLNYRLQRRMAPPAALVLEATGGQYCYAFAPDQLKRLQADTPYWKQCVPGAGLFASNCCPQGLTEQFYFEQPERYPQHPATLLVQADGDLTCDPNGLRFYNQTMQRHGARSATATWGGTAHGITPHAFGMAAAFVRAATGQPVGGANE